MKQLVKTADPISLPTVNYDRVIYNSETDNVIIKGANDNGHPYVDLGLPSGLKWAKYNVGATSETQEGDHFMWGETKPKTADKCNWDNYKFYAAPSTTTDPSITMTKYNTSTDYGENLDGMSTLRPEDDAARANMGGDWRMPTKDNFQELITYTDNKWIDNFDGNGTSGYKFTSKKNTNNYIFIPASQWYEDFSTYMQDISYGVWSSSLYTSRPREAWGLSFNSRYIKAEEEYTCTYDRYYGMVVRGVL